MRKQQAVASSPMKHGEQGTPSREKGSPKLTVRGQMLEVETSEGKPTGTQAKRAPELHSSLPGSHAHQPQA